MNIESKRIELLKRFIEEDGSDVFSHYALALEYVNVEQYENARRLFQYLLDNFADYLPTYFHFGKLLERLAELHQARDVFQKGMDLAQTKGDRHAFKELNEALTILNLNM